MIGRIYRILFAASLLVIIPAAQADRLGGDFTLTAHDNQRLSLDDLAGKPVLLAFGYTHCPDICPTTLAQFARVLDLLDARADHLHALFVTLDPARDDADHLAEYVSFFDPRLVGLTGTAPEIASVAQAYGVRYATHADGGALGYSVDHSTDIYLLDESGSIAAIFPFGTPAERISDAIVELMGGP